MSRSNPPRRTSVSRRKGSANTEGKLSKRNLVLASICAAAVAVPALAYGQEPPASATVDARDNSPTDHVWAPADATILKGGTVTFRNAAGNDAHLLQFTDTVTPSCSGTPP